MAASPVGSQPLKIFSLYFLKTTVTGNCRRDLTAKAFVVADLMSGTLTLVWFCKMISSKIPEVVRRMVRAVQKRRKVDQ